MFFSCADNDARQVVIMKVKVLRYRPLSKNKVYFVTTVRNRYHTRKKAIECARSVRYMLMV